MQRCNLILELGFRFPLLLEPRITSTLEIQTAVGVAAHIIA
jgi:hypothetical protein